MPPQIPSPKSKLDEVMRKISSIQNEIQENVLSNSPIMPPDVAIEAINKLESAKSKLMEMAEGIPDPIKEMR